MNELRRFLEAQDRDYARALQEVRNGRKLTHWVWYIFPQIAGLGTGTTSKFYAIRDMQEAGAYISQPVLRARLIEISSALLQVKEKSAREILGEPDDMKVRSCMTLFNSLPSPPAVFREVLDRYYAGDADEQTLALIGR